MAINGMVEASEADIEKMAEDTKRFLKIACDGGQACACLVLQNNGECDDASACSEPSGDTCAVTCAQEVGCSSQAFASM